VIGAAWLFTSVTTHANCVDRNQLQGVNLSGAEFNNTRLPGRLNFDYIYPTRPELEYFRDAGMTVIRLPFRWERLQPVLGSPLDAAELDQIRTVVGWAKELDMCVVLDLHNFGRYGAQVLGGATLSPNMFTDVWLRLAAEFKDPKQTIFGLMNEPSPIPIAQWTDIAQQTLLALRGAGASNLILVGSGRWSGAHEWNKVMDGTSAAAEFKGFRDPANNYAIELHQYADSNYSGTGTACIEPAKLQKILADINTWAKLEHRKFFLGEFGVANSAPCLAALDAMLEAMRDDTVWLGWSYWAAGRWWGTYPFSIQPVGKTDAAQMTVLKRFLRKPKPPSNIDIKRRANALNSTESNHPVLLQPGATP
jgi:endoglucanase